MILEKTAELLSAASRDLDCTVFRKWNRRLLDQYRAAEPDCFPPELLYSEEELLEREAKEGFEGLLASRRGQTAALLLIFLDDEPEMVYLDTLAVLNRGEGLGRAIIEALISASGKNGLKGISLDTERLNSKGQRLVEFYEKSGFIPHVEEESGNIHMILKFSSFSP